MTDRLFRLYYEIKRKLRYRLLKNKNISIITNNCLGGKLSHDFGLKLNSPIVNMQMVPEDFVKFCKAYKMYLSKDFCEVTNLDNGCKEKFYSVGGGDIDFPVANVGDITLYLQHYQNFEEAKAAWERRKYRIQDKKFFILITKKQGFENVIEDFCKLTIEKKVVLLIDKPYKKEIKNTKCICLDVPLGVHFMDRKKNCFYYYYEKYPFLKWFNGE